MKLRRRTLTPKIGENELLLIGARGATLELDDVARLDRDWSGLRSANAPSICSRPGGGCGADPKAGYRLLRITDCAIPVGVTLVGRRRRRRGAVAIARTSTRPRSLGTRSDARRRARRVAAISLDSRPSAQDEAALDRLHVLVRPPAPSASRRRPARSRVAADVDRLDPAGPPGCPLGSAGSGVRFAAGRRGARAWPRTRAAAPTFLRAVKVPSSASQRRDTGSSSTSSGSTRVWTPSRCPSSRSSALVNAACAGPRRAEHDQLLDRLLAQRLGVSNT